ncbi:MAG: lipopolysaccharide biosynthesis protein [Lachnospiraceae bacterium]|nr:lipopolysaccharide biosynthesis protein [Lachnospiraceae bacterium]
MKKNVVLVNLFWKFAERCGAQLVQFIVSVVLARILLPEVYGTVTLVLVFTRLLQVFVDSGFGNALIQKKDADELDFSSVFYFNIVACSLMYVGMYLVAPYIAMFYEDMSLIPIIRVMSLSIVVSGLKNVQQAYVSRTLQFKRFFYATLCGTISSGVVGVFMALRGAGVWALVGQHLTSLLVDTVVLWWTVKWRPKWIFSLERLKRLYSYGWKIFLSSLIDVGYNDLRQLIIGKLYSTSDLAFYEKGKQFPHLIINNVNASISSVLFPVMANAQDNPQKVKEMTRKAIITSSYIMSPLMMGLAFTAEAVVSLVLTDKWLFCVPFMRIFCITYMFYPIHTANLNAVKALGRSDLFLKLEIIKKGVGLIILLISMPYGVMAMAYSLLISSFTSQIINSWPNKKLLDYGYLEQLKDILPSIFLAVFMGICVFVIRWLALSDIVTLVLQVCFGGLLYIGLSALFKMEIFRLLIDGVKNRKK